MPLLPSLEREYITQCSSAAILEKVAYIGVRNVLLLFAQVFHKAKGLINKMPWDLISFKGSLFLKNMSFNKVY